MVQEIPLGATIAYDAHMTAADVDADADVDLEMAIDQQVFVLVNDGVGKYDQ